MLPLRVTSLTILVLLSALPAVAQSRAPQYETRGAHFRVRFDGPADDIMARGIVDRLETIYWRVGGRLTAYPPQAIEVVLYTTEQFRDTTRAPARAGAAFDGRIHLAVERILSMRGPSAVVTLLQDVAQGADFATAFHQRTAMRYDEFDAILRR